MSTDTIADVSFESLFSTTVQHRPSPPSRTDVVAELQACADACRDCVDDCLTVQRGDGLRESATLAATCGDVCTMTATLLRRSGEAVRSLSKGAVILSREASRECARECERHDDPARRACAAACRRLLTVLGDLDRTEEGSSPRPAEPLNSGGPQWTVVPPAR